MSIRGYFEPRGQECLFDGGRRPILGDGVVGLGPVLEGRMSLAEALAVDRMREAAGIRAAAESSRFWDGSKDVGVTRW